MNSASSSSSPSETKNENLEANQGSVDTRASDKGEEEVEEEEEGEEEKVEEDSMEEDDSAASSPSAGTVFQIKLKQPRSNLIHKMNVPGLCRKFSATAWCGKLNVIACASETCARIPSSNTHPPFWIPIHIVNPERPTEYAVFNVIADCPRDSVQFIEWSPASCLRALLVANFHGRITIWTQPYNGPTLQVRDSSCWKCEHEWRQDLAVVTKWLSGISPYSWLSLDSRSPAGSKSTIEERFVSQRPTTSARWPNFLCVCSVLSSGSVQLHWAQWPLSQSVAAPKWFSTSKAMLGAGPSGIMAADVIITEAGTLHVAGVPIVNPSTVVVWEVIPGPGIGFQATAMLNTSSGVPPSLNPPLWTGYAPLAAYLFSWQEYLSEVNQGRNQVNLESCGTADLHCSPVSNFSAYVSPEAAAQPEATTTWGSGVTAVAFDPARGGTVLSVVIVEGQYMSPYDPDAGPSITGWKIQCWESSLQSVVLHPIFENPESNLEGQIPMQTFWLTKVSRSIPLMNEGKSFEEAVPTSGSSDKQNSLDSHNDKLKRFSFNPLDLPTDIRTLARIVYSAHGDVAVSFLNGGVHIFLGENFSPVYNYIGNVVSAIAAPTFSSTGCCLASVWYDTLKDLTILKITRLLPPAHLKSKLKFNSATWERSIADRFWWSLVVGVDWWDVVGCTQSAVEDDIVSVNSVIAELDADFHSLSSLQHREQYRSSLDRIKCRLLEGINAQEVRALVLDMQTRLLLDMLGKGIESALINPAALISEPWLASGEMLSSIGPDAMPIEPALVSSIQGYVDAILDLTSHFITRLRRYAGFCRTFASHTVGKNTVTGSGRNAIASSVHSSGSPSTSEGQAGTSSSTGSSPMQAWMQDAIAKINSSTDGVSSLENPMGGSSSFIPISINTGTFPGTPAVRLIGDCHFLHRLCQLVFFCYFFWRRQLHRYTGTSQNNSTKKESNTSSTRPASEMVKSEEVQVSRLGPGAKGAEEGPPSRSQRLGSGNAGHGYTYEEVKVLLLIVVELCRRTSGLAHPLPSTQVGSSNIQIRLHYTDGNYTVLPEVVEASLGQHMQSMPRPRGSDAAGLLLRELELHPPSEDWHRRNMLGGVCSDTEDLGPLDDTFKLSSSESIESDLFQDYDSYYGPQGLWPKRRRLSERNAAFGLITSEALGPYLGLMGSRRDVLTAKWRKGLEGVWYKCIRCLRQTSAFSCRIMENDSTQNDREAWYISRWSHCCPMCGGAWVRVF